MSRICLFFIEERAVSLQRFEYIDQFGERRVSIRGNVAEKAQGTFQWTSGLKSLLLLLIGTKVHSLSNSGTATWYLTGERGSPAASLDYALSKSPQWLLDLFGADAAGIAIARRVIHRINPERKRPGPVKLMLNQNFCSTEDITIWLGDQKLNNLDSLLDLQKQITSRSTDFYSDGSNYSSRDVIIDKAHAANSIHTSSLIQQLAASRPVASGATADNLWSKESIRALWEMDRLSYGGYALPWSIFYHWWQRYPLGLKAFFVDSRMCGTLSIWPLNEKAYSELTDGQLKEEDLEPILITRSPELPTSYWYIGGIFITSKLSYQRHLATLLHSAISSWIADGNHLFPITMLALGSTISGIALLKRLGFRQLRPAGLMPDTFPLFELSVKNQSHLNEILDTVIPRS